MHLIIEESGKEESKKAGLKLNIQKTKIMASTHHFMGNRETAADFIYLFI